jgi:DNA polymerase-4
LPCSIGISGDKTTAKYAAKCQKPNGFTIIPPWTAKARLQSVPVTELCGIANGIRDFLARYGAHTCGDVAQLPISILAKRFGNVGRRIWYMCQGQDPQPLQYNIPAPQTMGHGKVMPPNTTEPQVIQTFLLHMSEKLAARLRRNQLQAQRFWVGLRSATQGWLGGQMKAVYPTQDGQIIFKLCQLIYQRYGRNEPISQVQVTALDPTPCQYQLDLLQQIDHQRQRLQTTRDAINLRYGEFQLAPARLLQRSEMPNVISPSWQPYGHRQIIH